MTDITLPPPIIQTALFLRPSKLPPSRIEKSKEKILFSYSQQKTKAGENVKNF